MPLPLADEQEWIFDTPIPVIVRDDDGNEFSYEATKGLASLKIFIEPNADKKPGDAGKLHDVVFHLNINFSSLIESKDHVRAMVKGLKQQKYVLRAQQVVLRITEIEGAGPSSRPPYSYKLPIEEFAFVAADEATVEQTTKCAAGVDGDTKEMTAPIFKGLNLHGKLGLDRQKKKLRKNGVTAKQPLSLIRAIEYGWEVGHHTYGHPEGEEPGPLRELYFQEDADKHPARRNTALTLVGLRNSQRIGIRIDLIVTRPMITTADGKPANEKGIEAARRFMRERMAGMRFAKDLATADHRVRQAAGEYVSAESLWIGHVTKIQNLYTHDVEAEPQPVISSPRKPSRRGRKP